MIVPERGTMNDTIGTDGTYIMLYDGYNKKKKKTQ